MQKSPLILVTYSKVDKNHLFLLVDILNAFKKQYKIKKISISRDIDSSSQWKNTLKTLI